jgi:hypothetical protein
MSRAIFYVVVLLLSFILGIATNWSVNTLGGFAVDKIYVDASIPSVLQT